jgi:dissimilatory sulfite reductase (desulfoviridin) alpha/beta subunit
MIDHENIRMEIQQKQEGYGVLRAPTFGRITSQQLKTLAKISREFGDGYALLTMRKGFEIPWINRENFGKALSEIEKTGLKVGSSGNTVRSILPCAGQDRCPFDILEVGVLTKKIRNEHYGRPMPMKFNITLCGCPNYCTHPYLSDIGIIGRARPRVNEDKCIGCGQCVRLCRGDDGGALRQVDTNAPEIDYEKCIECGWCIKNCPTGAMEAEKQGCSILVGGKGGANPKLGVELIRIISIEKVGRVLERIVQYTEEYSSKGERLADVIEKYSFEHFKNYVLGEIDD